MSRRSRSRVLPSLRTLFGFSRRPRPERNDARFSPLLERVEDRALLATLHVGSAANEFHQIQAAVNAANPGDTIQIDPGLYPEQLTIAQNSNGVTLNNLKLQGSNQNSIIQLPATAPASQQTAIVTITGGAQNVTLDKLTVEGPGNGTGSIGYGIAVFGGASANITNDHITHVRDNPLSGDQNGVAIFVGRHSLNTTGSATISHDTIDDYQKAGIVVDNVGSSAEIDHTVITGVGRTNLIAQNGIQISRGATAVVTQNNISGNVYTVQTYPISAENSTLSTGILLYSPGAVTVDHNRLTANDVGIYVFQPSGTVDIDHNTVTQSTFDGIELDTTSGAVVSHNSTDNNGTAVGGAGIRLFDSSTGNSLDHNESSNNAYGIFVEVGSGGNTFAQNQLSNNSVVDADDESAGAGVGTGTDGTDNTWTKNHGGTSSPGGLVS